MKDQSKKRLAILVSHPVQYYVPLYRRLARRKDLEVKVFFTWHSATAAVADHGFKVPVAWDIPLTEGYEFELIPNTSSDPGTHHFFGLRNPSLVARILDWHPDAVHITGWAWFAHLFAMWAFHRRGIPTLFRGDSHLLDGPPGRIRAVLKKVILRRIFSWPAAFLYVGVANKAYYANYGVDDARLCPCPHSIDVSRFAAPAIELEAEAMRWRRRLEIAEDQTVLVFAGKFERKKQPVKLMRTVLADGEPGLVLVMVGGGELSDEVNALVASYPDRFRVLPFQNQSLMPVVYRLGNIFVLPSAFGETWGLAVVEALACSRPVIVSDRVGCAADVIDACSGRVFPWDDFSVLMRAVSEMTSDRQKEIDMRRAASERAWLYDVERTEAALVDCLRFS